MAWVSSARAPLRRISVRESLKAPGWVSLITLLSDTAYHSFIGEVEALNTTTIRRLTRSRRHQLLAIARPRGLRAVRGVSTARQRAGRLHRRAESGAFRSGRVADSRSVFGVGSTPARRDRLVGE